MGKRAGFGLMGLKLGTIGSGPVQRPNPEMASGDVPVAQVAKQTPVVQAPPTASHAKRPEKFNGANFKRWQQKMLFYLTTLGLARFLTENAPPSSEESDKETLMAVDVWKNSNYLCQNYVLNGLSGSIYGVYCSSKSAKELWEILDRKYKTANAGSEKFVVGRFLDYMMVDTKPLMSQALVSKLCIEDDNRRSDRRSMKAAVKANVVEHRSSSKSQKKKLGMSSKLGLMKASPKRPSSKENASIVTRWVTERQIVDCRKEKGTKRHR
nr:uncharacterized protein LOC125422879 [Ziziphus jujuba var. spinosa]